MRVSKFAFLDVNFNNQITFSFHLNLCRPDSSVGTASVRNAEGCEFKSRLGKLL